MTDGQSRSDDAPADKGPRVDYPWTVRWMAAFWVISPAIGMLGFLALSVAAVVLYLRRGRIFDLTVIGTWAAAWACPLACAAFRRWFVWWGRRRWPDDPEAAEPADRHRPPGGMRGC